MSGVMMHPGVRSLTYIGLAIAAIGLAGAASEPREAEAQRADPSHVAASPAMVEAAEPAQAIENEPACAGGVWPYVDPDCLDGAPASRPITRVLTADGDLDSRRAAELRRLAGGRPQ